MYMKTAPKTAPATAPPSLGSSSEPITRLLLPCEAVSWWICLVCMAHELWESAYLEKRTDDGKNHYGEDGHDDAETRLAAIVLPTRRRSIYRTMTMHSLPIRRASPWWAAVRSSGSVWCRWTRFGRRRLRRDGTADQAVWAGL
jgi:hypothetical protein